MKKIITISLLLLAAFSFSFGQTGTVLKAEHPEVKIENNQLNVAWQVQEQGNIDHYDILLSEDGTDFKSIGTVKSKALEGDNSSLLGYTFHIDFGTATKTLGYAGFIGLLSFGFSRKRKWAMLFPVIALFTIIA